MLAQSKKNEALLLAYQKVGLDKAFAQAIVNGGNATHIVDTWKAEWRNSHGAEHPAIRAVLEGKATPAEAKSLLEAAELHHDLVEAVASGQRTMKWAHVVLSTNFKGKPDAISALLDGADPSILSHLLDIPLSKDEAKNIGRKHHGTKKSESVSLKGMTKNELIVECEKARLMTSGSGEELMERVSLYRNRLREVLKAYTTGTYPTTKANPMPSQRNQHSYRARYYWVQYPNGGLRRVSETTYEMLNTRLAGGSPNASRNKTAMRYLTMKSRSYSVDAFRTYVLDQSLRHGLLDHDEHEDLIEGGSNFNKV